MKEIKKQKSAPKVRAKAKKRSDKASKRATVVDLFCGVGGLSHGFYLEGMKIAAGIDLDPACEYAYKENNNAQFVCRDVSRLTARDLEKYFGDGPRVLVGCAPCQPFSSYAQRYENPEWKLLDSFAKLIVESKPDVVSMENVPRLLDFQDGKVIKRFVRKIKRAGYEVTATVAYAPDYGVPQHRHRLVLLASRHGKIELAKPTHTPKEYVSVRNAIGKLPKLEAGGIDAHDPLHRTSRLSDINLRRIQAATPGGSWKDWDEELIAPCHQTETGKTYVSVYGRMKWDEPSPTMTTQFYGFGNGRFGHPQQDRAISLREGAILQSFPPEYRFFAEGERVQFKKMGRLIGNAVPVLLGRAIAKSIRTHLDSIKFADAA